MNTNALQSFTVRYLFCFSHIESIQTEYYLSMFIRRFVSLRVACVKSYNARPSWCDFKNHWFTLTFTLKSKNNICVTSQLACYWLHKVGGWYGILIRYTRRKHDTGFSIPPVFVSSYYIYIKIIRFYIYVCDCVRIWHFGSNCLF